MTHDDIIRMAREHLVKSEYTEFGWQECHRYEFNDDELLHFAALVAAHEREACARIADTYGGPEEPMMVGTYEAGWHNAAEAIAADIRAKGHNE